MGARLKGLSMRLGARPRGKRKRGNAIFAAPRLSRKTDGKGFAVKIVRKAITRKNRNERKGE